MVGVLGGTSEVVLICVADSFTGAMLLNRLVYPAETVVSWRTKIHGIKRSAVQTALSQGQALSGWKGARAELWKFIDSDTIIVGHALHHDLDVLRMIHHRVVDSAILARNAVGVSARQWGLKGLCHDLLHIELCDNKGEVHDCIEDVLATREVVLWCTRNQQELEAWETIKRTDEARKEEQRKKLQQAKKSQVAEMERRNAPDPNPETSDEDVDSNSEGSGVLLWSDVAEDLGWPHPDTGYDPFSD